MAAGGSPPDGPDNDDALAGFVDGGDHDTVLSTGTEDQFEARTVLSAPDPALLAMTPPVPPPEVHKSVPKLLAVTDVAPGFRAGVKLTRNAVGGYEIQDEMTGEVFALNEFEGSLARMLNGHRPISEILEAGRRLSIPINLESVQKFIQQLEANDFLGTVGDAETRGEWETSVRTLFQSGIRLLRAGRHSEAAGYFEAVLQEDASNIEARELLAMAHARPVEAVPPVRTPNPEGMAPPTGLSDTISAVAPYEPVPYAVRSGPAPVRRSWFGVIALVTITVLIIVIGILANQFADDPTSTMASVPSDAAPLDAAIRVH